jgi:hypothetical protein
MDKFKKYLQQHTDELGNEEPTKRLWDNINQHLIENTSSPRVYSNRRYLVAAGIIGLTVIGSIYFFNHSNKITNVSLAKETIIKKDSDDNKPENNQIEKPVIAAINHHSIQKTGISVNKPSGKKKVFNDTELKGSEMIESVDKSFASLISLQKDKINETPVFTESPAYFNDFYQQLHQMDEDEKLLRKDIATNGLTNKLLSQLINIYKQKLLTLGKFQTEINKTNTRYKQNKMPNSIQKNYFLHL